MNKNLIHSRFAKNLSSYDEKAITQKIMAKKLLEFSEGKSYSKILEIGCGTGLLTNLLSENTKWENYIAIDIVGECQDYISKINNNIEFIEADIEDYLKDSSEKFDLIISNAALQWVNDFETTVRNLHKMLNSGGQLLFSTFGIENFREIYHILGTSLNYYSSKELKELFRDLQPNIEEEIHIMSFKTPKEVLQHLKLTGVNAIENKSWTKSDLTKFEKGYSNLCPIRPTLTYHPIYIKICAN